METEQRSPDESTTEEALVPAGASPAEGGGRPDALVAALSQLENRLQQGIEDLLDRFDKKLAYDGFKEEQISRLHGELQEHKRGLLVQAVRPLILGIVRLHGDLDRVVTALRQHPAEELTPERFFSTLDGFRDDIELLLGQHGVEPFRLPGDDFDPARQTAVRTVPASRGEQVGRVVERLRPGFARGEETLTRERVVVAADSETRTAIPERTAGEEAVGEKHEESPVTGPGDSTEGETE